MDTPNDPDSVPSGRRGARRRRSAEAGAPVRAGRFAAGLALVFAILALLASGYVGYIVNSKRGLTDAKGRLVQVEQDTARLETLTTQMDQELASLRDSQQTLRGNLQSLNAELGKGRRAWLLAEAEDLLVTAQDRLLYARDARLALAALRAADHQLQQLADPDYAPVRKQLEREAQALEEYERVDPAAMAQRLGELAGGVNALPLAPAPRPAPAGGEAGFASQVWHDLKELVRVRNTADTRRPLLLPEQQYFLRENLRLMLYGAQVALLHGDAATFETNTRAAHQWLRDYYDGHAATVQTAIAALDTVLHARPAGLPETGAALKALREVRARLGNAP